MAELPPPASSTPLNALVATLRAHVARDPDGTAFRHIGAEADWDAVLTRAGVDARARAVAAALNEHGVTGGRVLLLLPGGFDLLSGVLGCLYAGVAAVPCAPPGEPRNGADAEDGDRFVDIGRDAGVSAVLTGAADAADMHARWMRSGGDGAAVWLAADRLGTRDGALWEPPRVGGAVPAMVQYTSGSTGRPKGVTVTHDQMGAQIANFRALTALPDGASVVNWMPLHHALGLGHMLLAAAVGGTGVFLDPDRFVAEPARWLDAVSATEGPVLGGGPNFAYQRCVDRITPDERERLDLSCWHTALIGGEGIQPRTLEEFARTFAPCGFRPDALLPAYGLTETMQVVTTRRGAGPAGIDVDAKRLEQGHACPPADGEQVRTLMPCGAAGPEATLHVVDPDTRRRCADDEVGEVWVSGPAVCDGYWQRPEETAETFGARLADGDGPFLRTGDLGFLRNGELVVCGRLKELVIVNGRNIQPQDIEWSVRRALPHPERPAVAFAMPAGDGQPERLVVVAEVDQATTGDPDALAGSVHEAVVAEHRIVAHRVVLVQPHRIPRTDGGKLRRAACRDAWTAGRLEPLAATGATVGPVGEPGAADANPVPDMLRALEGGTRAPVVDAEVRRRLAAVTGLPPDDVPADRTLAALGVESLGTIALRHALETAFGVTLPVAEFFSSTVGDIAARISRELAGPGPDDAEAPAVEPAWPVLVADEENRFEPFPLTELQQAYLVGRAANYELGGSSIHLYAEHDCADLDPDRLRAALDALARRQEMLRAVVSSDGTQRILPEVGPFPVLEYDLRDADEQERRRHVDGLRAEMGHQVLPLDTWPMCDIRITWTGGRRARAHVSLDLLVFDVASVRLFFLELGDLYRDPNAALPEPGVSFRDFVLAARQIPETERYRRSREYWTARVATLPPAPDLPLLSAPSVDAVPRRRRRRGQLDAARWDRLRARAADLGVTPTSVLLASYATALGRWSRTSHFTIDVPLFSRYPLHPDIEQILGDFTSISLLEVDLRPGDGIGGLARRLQDQMWRDLEHRYFSGIEVMRAAAKAQGVSPGAFASIVFASTREHGRDQDFEQGEWGSTWLGELVYGITQTPQVLLDHQVYESDGALTFNWDAVEARFPAGLLDDVFAAYLRVLEELADRDQAWHPGGVDPLPGWQRDLVLAANSTAGPVPQGHLFSGLVEQARDHPDRPAVIAPDRTLSFGALYRHACRVGRVLRGRGAEPNQLVAVAIDKSAEQVVGAVAAQLAGAAYLPLDPDLPRARQDHLLDHGQVGLVITRTGGPDRDWPSGVERVVVDLDAPPGDDRPLEPVQQPTDLAYVLYTSGSTGEPKGVMQTHRATLNTLVDASERMEVGAPDRVLGLSALSFDLSVWDVFGALGRGAALVLPEPDATRDPARWLELMEQHGVSVWNSVPALMRMLIEHVGDRTHPGTAALRAVWFSGDWIPTDLPDRVRAVAPGARVTASGGPTETAIWCVANPLGTVDRGRESIPYGTPMRNHTIHVLDDRMESCPVLCPGEMYIGGVGLAEGYWRDPARTDAVFVTHPHTGERLYRSGDAGRWLDDGQLEILGRIDHQVQLNGYRVELGEIEAALGAHDGVGSVAVTMAGEADTGRRLVAFVVPAGAAEPATQGPDAADYGGDELDAEITGPVQRLEFKVGLPGRRTDVDDAGVELPRALPDLGDPRDDPDGRSSRRTFAPDPVPLADLAGLLETLRAHGDGPLPRYRYASAGSLYPVQTYVSVVTGRVDGLDGGTYYYDPGEHRLRRTGPEALELGAHLPDNRGTVECSAFTIVLVAQRGAIEPLYGHRTRDFCLIEAGLMTQLLDDAAPGRDIGLCQVGLVHETDQLRRALALDDGHTVVHGLVGGARAPVGNGPDPGPPVRDDLVGALREHVTARLPHYMRPASYVVLDRLPLTARGKLDRAALMRTAWEQDSEQGCGNRGRVEPRGETERTVTEIVREVLDTEHVGVLDNFFDLGADSVVVVRVHRRLCARLGRSFPLMAMFEHPNIRRLAEYLAEPGDRVVDGPERSGTAAPEGAADAGRHRGDRRASARARRATRRTRT